MKLRSILFITGAVKPLGGFQTRLTYLASLLSEQGISVSLLLKDPLTLPNQHIDVLRRAGVRLITPGHRAAVACRVLSLLLAPILILARVAFTPFLNKKRLAGLTVDGFARGLTWRRCLSLERRFDKQACRAVRKTKAQIAHVFRPDEITSSAIAGATRAGAVVVYSETGEARRGLPWYGEEIVSSVRKVDVVFVTSHLVARNARDLYGPTVNVSTFPPLVPEAPKAPDRGTTDEITLCYAGRISEEKNLHGLLEALAKAQSDTPWHLLVAGDGPDRSRCEKLAADLNIQHKVTFLGSYAGPSELSGIAARTDLFVLPSKTEGFPVILVEVASTNRPILATNVGGVTEILRDGENGFLAPSSSQEDLVATLERALASRERLADMGHAARRLYDESFHPEHILHDMTAAYEKLLEPSGPEIAASAETASATPAISFLITNYNMRRLVEACIDHLTDHMNTTKLSYEILIADNSSDPEFALDEAACQRWPNVRFTRVDKSSGWTDGLNALIPQTRGEVVCIMHPDVEFERDCVAQCAAFMCLHPDVAVVAPNPYRSDGEPAKARLRFPSLSADVKRFANLLFYLALRSRPLAEEPCWDRRSDAYVDSVLSFCFFCQGEMLRAMAPIDAKLTSWYANDYICLQAQRSGQRVMYLKKPRIIHYERRTPRALYGASEEMEYKGSAALGSPGMQRDRLRFIRCFRPGLVFLAFKAITIAEFTLHAFCARFGRGEKEDAKKRSAAYWSVVRDTFRA